MKDLKQLEQKYAELGKEIEALKNKPKYPIYCLSSESRQIVKFTELNIGEVVKQGIFTASYDVKCVRNSYVKHTNTDFWQQLDVCPKTGFYDGQLVWCWDADDTHRRELRFYDAKNGCVFTFNGERDGHNYDNYEAYEGNWPQWALEAFETLER